MEHRILTEREAAFVLGVEPAALDSAIETRQSPSLTLASHLFLATTAMEPLFDLLQKRPAFTPASMGQLLDALLWSRQRKAAAARAPLRLVEIHATDEAARARIQALDALRAFVDDEEKPSPLIKGTTIEAYRVAALLRPAGDHALSTTEALFDFPSLSQEQALHAGAYARVYPNPGKPFPSESLKRLLLSGELGGIPEMPDSERW